MVWAGPLFEGHVCSLGYAIVDTIEAYMCHGEGDLQGQPAQVDQEMADHIIECYRIDPQTGRRVYNEAVLSRAKGRAKSEIAAWVVVIEAFFECRFSHWDEHGQPVAKRVESPLIKCLATEEGQAGNTFKTVAYIVGEWGSENHPEIYVGAGGVRKYQSATAIYLPDGGEIRACTAGAASKDGGLESHVVADETHLYIYDELRAMYATISRNLGKRFEADPWLHQTSTAYAPGEQSVFEETFKLHRAGELPPEVFINHRQASGKLDLTNDEQTKRQLREAYGEAAAWIDLDRKIRDMRDPRKCKDAAEAARYFLNRPESGDGSWIAVAVHDRQNAAVPASTLDPRPRPDPVVKHGTAIAIGFDGSLNDDTTVLRGCRMSDGLLFRLGAWPKPSGAAGIGWSVPRLEVLATINLAFELYDVVRGNFDPHEWRSDIDTLAERWGTERVFKFETRVDTRMAAALDRLHTGLTIGETWHDGDPLATEHYGNAYVAKRGKLRLVRKENPNSSRKIDTVVGDALALEARADALTEGWGKEPEPELPPLVFGM